jgi:YHS domain-containing protein
MQTSTREKDPDRSVDPVFSMFVSNTSEFSVDLDGDRYFFCCEPLAQKSTGNPHYYLGRDPATAPMSLSSVSVTKNALRPRNLKIQGLSSPH